MILDDLREKALESVRKNNLVLENCFIGELFSYVTIKDENISQIGVTLTPNGEGNIFEKHFNSLEELLNETSYNPSLRALTLAAVNAVGQYELREQNINIKDDLRHEIYDLILKNSNENDNIVFIGHLRPLISKLKGKRENVQVFCRTKVEPEIGVYI